MCLCVEHFFESVTHFQVKLDIPKENFGKIRIWKIGLNFTKCNFLDYLTLKSVYFWNNITDWAHIWTHKTVLLFYSKPILFLHSLGMFGKVINVSILFYPMTRTLTIFLCSSKSSVSFKLLSDLFFHVHIFAEYTSKSVSVVCFASSHTCIKTKTRRTRKKIH